MQAEVKISLVLNTEQRRSYVMLEGVRLEDLSPEQKQTFKTHLEKGIAMILGLEETEVPAPPAPPPFAADVEEAKDEMLPPLIVAAAEEGPAGMPQAEESVVETTDEVAPPGASESREELPQDETVAPPAQEAQPDPEPPMPIGRYKGRLASDVLAEKGEEALAYIKTVVLSGMRKHLRSHPEEAAMVAAIERVVEATENKNR